MLCTKDKDSATSIVGYDATTAQANFDVVNTKLSGKLSQPGNANISAGEFDPFATELQMTQNDWKDTSGNFIVFTSFTKEEAWARVKVLLNISDTFPVLWSQVSVKYSNNSL